MTPNLRNMSLAFALMVSTAPLLSLQAEAKSSFMEQCSALYKAGKADGSVAETVKWTDFMKSSCSQFKATDATATAPAEEAPAAKPPKAKKPKKADTAAVAPAPAAPADKADTTTTTASGSFMQNCSTDWKALKAADQVPAGMAWKDFVAAKCVVAKAVATDPVPTAKPKKKKKADPVVMQQDETPDEPIAADTGPVKTMDKNGKPFTAGQLAAHARARACGLEWRTAKAGGRIKAGQKWPQYWSECNTRMKADGQ
jgi:hypothetical protein